MDEPVLTDPLYDIGVGRLHFSKAEHRLAGVTYVQRKPVAVWFLPSFALAQAAVDGRRPQTNNVLVGSDDAEQKFLFVISSPQHPGTYEVLDLGAKTLVSLADAAPWLNGPAAAAGAAGELPHPRRRQARGLPGAPGRGERTAPGAARCLCPRRPVGPGPSRLRPGGSVPRQPGIRRPPAQLSRVLGIRARDQPRGEVRLPAHAQRRHRRDEGDF